MTSVYPNDEARDDTKGSAIVFWHTVEASPPASLVRAISLRDIEPLIPGGSKSEKNVCRAKFRDGAYPCIVLWLQEDVEAKDLAIKNLLDPVREKEFEDKGRRWAAELNLMKPKVNVLSAAAQAGTPVSEERRGSRPGPSAGRSRADLNSTGISEHRQSSRDEHQKHTNQASHLEHRQDALGDAGKSGRDTRRARSESPELNSVTKRGRLVSSPTRKPEATRSILKRSTPLPTRSRQSSVSPTAAMEQKGSRPRGGSAGGRSRGRGRARTGTPNARGRAASVGPNLMLVKPPPIEALLDKHMNGVDVSALQGRIMKLDMHRDSPFRTALVELFTGEELVGHVPTPHGARIQNVPLLDQDRLSCAVRLAWDFCDNHGLPEPDGKDLARLFYALRGALKANQKKAAERASAYANGSPEVYGRHESSLTYFQ